MERIFATYRIETPLAVEQAAAVLAGEQSSGTFVEVPGETAELKQRFAARVEKITPLVSVTSPALPGCRGGSGKIQRAKVVVSWSLENMGYNLPTLVSTIQGNLYELSQFSGLKLTDLQVPASFGEHFRGPKFGMAGCRALTGVYNRPLVGTIIIPFFRHAVGMSAYEYFGHRFGYGARAYSALAFTAGHFSKMGFVLYLMALTINSMTGWNIFVVILVVGVLTVLYTLVGGLEAVIWTDVVQGIIMVAGLGVVIGFLCHLMPGDLPRRFTSPGKKASSASARRTWTSPARAASG
ncbi:MAG TPA: hypothetical protein VFV96_17410 [Verrucomicrobiae bacterium]|nr:hypothetical protein [Verrucomicrobiae bacterium]